MYRKRYYRKKTYPKRRYGRKTSSWSNTAKKALSIAKKVANLVNAEYKFKDDIQTGVLMNYNGTLINSLLNIPQDVTSNGRTGDSIKLKNLTWRFELKQGGTTEEVVRVILFIDKEDSITGVNELLQTVGTSMGVYSPKNEDNKYNSKILFDKDFKLTNEYPIVKLEKVIKLDFHVNYVSTTTTIKDNYLKIAIIGQNLTGGGLYSHYSRITYLDN